MKSELEALRKESSDLKARVRTLEQKNDDLERAERISTAQLEDVEKKMNETLERCAILENELADKIAAEEHNFRLRFVVFLGHECHLQRRDEIRTTTYGRGAAASGEAGRRCWRVFIDDIDEWTHGDDPEIEWNDEWRGEGLRRFGICGFS